MWVGSCLMTIQSYDNSTWWVLTTQIQSSNGFPPPPPVLWLCFECLAVKSHFGLFAVSHSHMATFYNSFAKKTTLFFGKVAHIEKFFWFNHVIHLTTVDLLNDYGDPLNHYCKICDQSVLQPTWVMTLMDRLQTVCGLFYWC